MSQQRVTDDILATLFPVPSPAPSPQAPSRFPGVTPESTAALQRTLKDNHLKWHVFFNYIRFHNHAAHQLLAIYQLGATGSLLDAAYLEHCSNMRPACESPEPITQDNFHEHLGDENFYNAYLNFFTSVLLEKGAAATIEEYVFSAKANIEPSKPDHPPMRMVNRFFSGLLHSFIHTGYGAEFGLLGIFAEGTQIPQTWQSRLAMTAVHEATAPALTPPSPTQYATTTAADTTNSLVSRMTSLLPTLVLDQVRRVVQPPQSESTSKRVHALSLVSRIAQDDYYSYKTLGFPLPNDGDPLELTFRLRGDALAEMMSDWTVDGSNAQEVASKIEELFWTNVIIYGVCGWGGRKHSTTSKFKADFFFMHLVTSVLFLPSLAAYLSPTSTTILLRTYLLNTLALYVSRGSPPLPLSDFFDSTSATPAPPAPSSSPHSKPADGTLVPDDLHPNPWLALLQSTIMHPDDHLCKLQRGLGHFASLYGTTPAGRFEGVEVDGVGKIDGTLFVRVAGLSMDRLGWMREGQERGGWDFDGFYHDYD